MSAPATSRNNSKSVFELRQIVADLEASYDQLQDEYNTMYDLREVECAEVASLKAKVKLLSDRLQAIRNIA